MIIQSVLFRNNVYNIPDCLKWLKTYNLNSNKVDKTLKFYRWRQVSPNFLRKEGYNHYITKTIDNGNILLIEAYK